MGVPIDLEALRSIFKDKSTHAAVGQVIKLGLAEDRSVLRAQCRILSQERDVIAKVCWDASGPDAGSFQFPQVDDLVLIEFAEGDDNQAYLTRRLSTDIDKIPIQATENHLVQRALAGKKLHLLSDTMILLGKGAAEPVQPLVLGTVLQTLLVDLLTQLSTQAEKIASLSQELNTLTTDLATHTHPYLNVAVPATTGPTSAAAAHTATGVAINLLKSDFEAVKTELDDLKAEPIENGDILSALAFTEK